MTQPDNFCATFGRQSGEALAGTGAHPERMVLIRWPKSRWSYAMREAADMGGPLRDAIQTVTNAGWRVNLVDRKNDAGPIGRVIVVPRRQSFDIPPDHLADFLLALAADNPLTEYRSTHATAEVVLCCTHGQHDRCCAKFGFAAYRLLAAAAQEYRDRFDVWESTHLGGCRFSGNAVFTRSMRKYGRIGATDAAAIIAAESNGQAWLPSLRGTSHLSPEAQVAEIAALQAIGGHTQYPALEIDLLQATDSARDFHVKTHAGVYFVRCEATISRSHDSCSDLGDDLPLKERQAWTAVQVRKGVTPRANDLAAADGAGR
ncbi:sucrase ferredoxin [Falsihalocynthiibacter sp. S25ZX9]|uniref:sucrase ferredoxin n=1 Tax=Falsihalocynthiibacter sp. S25ZX9 TaxID=3240870 RepID=UPI003510B421